MRNSGVHYLLVLEDSKVMGIVSIRDLVKSIIADQKSVIDWLGHYKHG
jgi:CBS domain-containing protein